MIDPVAPNSVQPAKTTAKTEKVQEKARAPRHQTAPKAPVVAKEAAAKVPLAKVDTVDLTMPAQARLMQQQGLTANQIALRLDLDIDVVSRYLAG